MPVTNLKSHLAAVVELFRVPADNPELMRAQFDAFSKQIPLLYFILITNTIAVAYTYVPLAPASLSMIVPAVLIAVTGFRTFWWLRQRRVVRTDADILRNLRFTNWIAAPIGAGFTAWSFALYPYGDTFAKSQVAFYMAVTVIGCIFSLMHLRSAALIVTLVVDVPYVLSSGPPASRR